MLFSLLADQAQNNYYICNVQNNNVNSGTSNNNVNCPGSGPSTVGAAQHACAHALPAPAHDAPACGMHKSALLTPEAGPLQKKAGVRLLTWECSVCLPPDGEQ